MASQYESKNRRHNRLEVTGEITRSKPSTSAQNYPPTPNQGVNIFLTDARPSTETRVSGSFRQGDV